jgi:hypothetical protein
MTRNKDQHRIHQWDRSAALKALLWAMAIEGVIGVVSSFFKIGSGPPHNFPSNPIILLLILSHLPSIMIAGLFGLGSTAVIVLQTFLMAYIVFVRERLKKIKVRLY